jgi:hypothetical protein
MSDPEVATSAAQAAKEKPREHVPKLVLSRHGRGTRPLDRVAEGVNRDCRCLAFRRERGRL